jgi:hypothetical protein
MNRNAALNLDSLRRAFGLICVTTSAFGCTAIVGDLDTDIDEELPDSGMVDGGAERLAYGKKLEPRAIVPNAADAGLDARLDAGADASVVSPADASADAGVEAGTDSGAEVRPPQALNLVPLEQVGEDTGHPGIIYAAALAGYYILRVQDPDVGYHYEYLPETGEYSESDNVHRKSGATFTLAWLYRVTERDEFRVGTLAGLEYLTGRGEWLDDEEFELRDLGGTSLIALSLTEYAKLTGSDEWDDHIEGVGNYLLKRIQDDGSFSQGKSLQWAQAHQALWRLYAHTRDERYIDALEDVAGYFYDHRDDSEIFGSAYLYGLWANEPLTDLYLERGGDSVRDVVLEVGDEVVASQFDEDNAEEEDWIGGYSSTTSSARRPNWNSTLKLEAVIDAYRMAVLVDDEERVERFGRSALAGAEFLMRLQHRRGETGEFADPPFAVGGVPFEFDDPTVRVDVPHHMANAILKVAVYMDLEDYPGR